MPVVTLPHLLSVCKGKVSDDYKDLLFSRYVFDSRSVNDRGTLFFALQGDKQDGHRYIPELSGREGVAAVVRHDYRASVSGGVPLIRVDDPLRCAQILAVEVRSKLLGTRFVGVTGSAGKTSAKEFIFQILSRKNKSYRSPGNWNNWLGLPFALLNMAGDEAYGVFELGMSSPGIGEIAFLTNILKPDIAVILNALPVHLEFLQNVDQVAKAKCEILTGLGPEGRALYNIDCAELAAQLLSFDKEKLIPFSPTQRHGQLYFTDKRMFSAGVELKCVCFGKDHTFFTPLTHPAQHVNILVAIGVAFLNGLDSGEISESVSALTAVEGRGVIKRVSGMTILDETYNSNPEAARYALDWLASFPGPRVAVLGDMRELGEKSDDFHQQLGRYAASLRLKQLITVGVKGELIAKGALENGMPEAKVNHFTTVAECKMALKEMIALGDVVLFKASRGVALERALPE